MATNTNALKNFARQTRVKLVSLVTTKLQYVLHADTAELRGYETQIERLRREIAAKSEQEVIEEVAYTWFNRVMALRYMDANGYNAPKVVTPALNNMRPEILQDAMGGIVDDELRLSPEDKLLPEEKLYRKLLVAVCNKFNGSMPFLFELLSDYTELLLPDDLLSTQSFVTDIRNGMTDEDCQNVEIIGWLYQFYITDRKADAETKKSKKGGLKSDEQAAATQLFTPHWIVRYMVENSLGRIWMTMHPNSPLKTDMPYYINTPEGQTDVIPEDIHSVQDIRFLDPCMGSGHILVYAFDLLCKMYEEEGFMPKEIPGMVLENNIFGMDIDLRCYQLTCFVLTMKARAYYSRYLRRTVQPNVIALKKIDHDVIASCDAWPTKSLMWQFENIDTIGSLLKVTEEEYEKIPVSTGLFGPLQKELKDQARFLSRKYHCVVTNPPYLGKGLGEQLKGYMQSYFPNSKLDTMATFMEKNLDFCSVNGKISMINMQSWMTQPSYEKLRFDLLSNSHFINALHLGPHAFDEISGEIVQSVSFVMSNNKSENTSSFYQLITPNSCDKKEDLFLSIVNSNHSAFTVRQQTFLNMPGYILGYWGSEKMTSHYGKVKFGDVVIPRHGLATSDNNRFLKLWHEVSINKCSVITKNDFSKKWYPINKGGAFRKWYGNINWVINYENDGEEIKDYAIQLYKCSSRTIQNTQFYFKKSLTWSALGSGPLSLRWSDEGAIFGSGAHSAFASDEEMKYALAFMNSKVSLAYLKLVSPTLNTNVDDLRNIPYIVKNESVINGILDSCIEISRKDWDTHEFSWDFQVNELVWMAQHATAWDGSALVDKALPIASLVDAYKEKWTEMFHKLHKNEEELNRQFIEIYGLQNELTPDVPLNEVTILQKGEISIDEDNRVVWHDDVIVKQLISYFVGCFMGRYSVDKPGLIIASQGMTVDSLGIENSTLEIDDDAIIPIISEPDFFADDMAQRIEKAIRLLFGESAFYDNMRYLKACLGKELREYLYSDYYTDHMQMYSIKGAKRPIYWLFSSKMGDKKKSGCFKALVYMHRLEPDTLSRLHAEYVLPYRNKLEQQLREASDEATRDDLSTAARNRAIRALDELQAKVREVREYETVLVEMASHRLSIDLDEGVRINYPKYYPLVEPIKGLDSAEE